jgi:hypothetical protein
MKIKCLLTLKLIVTNLIVPGSYFRQPSNKHLTEELVKNSNVILMVECWMQCAVTLCCHKLNTHKIKNVGSNETFFNITMKELHCTQHLKLQTKHIM